MTKIKSQVKIHDNDFNLLIYLDGSIQFGTINLDDKLDHNGLTFLQESTRHPETFAGSSRPSVMLYKREEAERVKVEKITNVSIVSITGTIYNGFKGRYMTYEETETLCLSKGAKMPWFEIIGSQFSEPVWIKYDRFLLYSQNYAF